MEFMNGKQEELVNPIVSFMLEARAGVHVSQGHYLPESVNTAETDPIKKILLMTPWAEGMSSGFALRFRAQFITPGRMLKGWKTSF